MVLFYLNTSIINTYNHFCGVYLDAFTYKRLICVTELGNRHIKLIIPKALGKKREYLLFTGNFAAKGSKNCPKFGIN